MTRRNIANHFLPHFFTDPQSAHLYQNHNAIHHSAHALSNFSLFVYLQVVLAITVGFWVINIKNPQILGQITFSSQEIISLSNEKRRTEGLPELVENGLLAQAAQAKAADMHANNYWAHTSPSGKTPWYFISQNNYHYVFAGENLARDFGDARSVVDAWMNSPSHRSNLMDKNFKEIGVSVSEGKLDNKDGILVVQMFGTSVSQSTPQQAVSTPAPKPQTSTPKPETIPSPKAQAQKESPQPTVIPTPTPSPIAAEASIDDQISQSPQAVLAQRQFSIAKITSLVAVAFIFLLFLLEAIITLKRENVRVRKSVFAHLALLGFMLFAVWYAVGGAIL